jgi:ABC-type phosphate transport system substrate-binding protein
MMKQSISIILLSFSSLIQANTLVIVNAHNSVTRLEHKQVVDLFMGRSSVFPDKEPAQTLDLKAGTPVRASFYKTLTGKSEAQVDAYWATLIFAGRMSPPKQLTNEQQVIAEVAANPNAIAYVNRQPLPASVKIVMELDTPE